MAFLLDTDTCISILRGRPKMPGKRLHDVPPASVHVSTIVRAELLFGARHSSSPAENLRLVEEFLAPLTSVPFDNPCADAYGSLREELTRQGQLIGPNDMLIAATALAHDLTLVSHNTREFSRIVGLRLTDWHDGPSDRRPR